MMKPLARILLAAMVVAACGESVAPPPFSGTFALSTLFTSSAPPVVLYVYHTGRSLTNRSEIYADTLLVNANGTWQERTTYRLTENVETTPVVTYPTATGSGTWTIDANSALTFTLDAGQGAMLYNLGMKPATIVAASVDALTFQNVIQFNLDWTPHFVRVH